MFLHILVVGYTVFYHRTGDKVLQFILVPLVEGFELVVNVYDEVLPDIGERVLLLRVYLSRVAVTVQSRRTEQVKERCLELSLFSCQYKAGVVTTLSVVHGVGNHCHEPLGEVRQPFFSVADGNTRSEIGNCALTYLYLAQYFRSINRWQSLEVFRMGLMRGEKLLSMME